MICVTRNIIIGSATDETHSLEPSEDYAFHYLTRSVLKMMDNIGFSTCHESVLNILADLCKRYLQKLWIDSKIFAEHGNSMNILKRIVF